MPDTADIREELIGHLDDLGNAAADRVWLLDGSSERMKRARAAILALFDDVARQTARNVAPNSRLPGA